MEPVSILVIAYASLDTTLNKIRSALKNQNYGGKFETIFISRKRGLADNINYGARKAKYNIVVTLHGDCIPDGADWLTNLIKPFKDKKVVASVSKVHLPIEMWDSFGIFARSITLKEKGTITPALDEKGCAYRKSILKKVGMFDEETFRRAGEDFDIYIKLKKKGIIAYPDATVIHLHATTFRKRIDKTYQYANGFGALLRIYGKKMPGWWRGLLKAIPLFGSLVFVFAFPFDKGLSLYPFYLLTIPILHVVYACGFWKGFLTSRQTV